MQCCSFCIIWCIDGTIILISFKKFMFLTVSDVLACSLVAAWLDDSVNSMIYFQSRVSHCNDWNVQHDMANCAQFTLSGTYALW